MRHHASLLVWLNGSDNPPPADVERAYLEVEADTHWPNPILPRPRSTPTTVTGDSGVKMTGPYDYVAPSYWYVDQHNGGAFGFNTETSPGPAIPSLASREKFLPDPKRGRLLRPGASTTAAESSPILKSLMRQCSATYAKPHSAADYERIAQTMEYDSERAMFEAYGKNKYVSTGVIQWMLNNAWPSMIWHLYDYYLDAGAGYYATKKACEPLHIQYAYDDQSIVVVNSTYTPAAGLHAQHPCLQPRLEGALHRRARLSIPPPTARSACSRCLRTSTPELTASSLSTLSSMTLPADPVSHNFYWVPGTLTTFDWAKTDYTHTPAARYEDLTALATLPAATSRRHAQRSTTTSQVAKSICTSRTLRRLLHSSFAPLPARRRAA